MPSRAVQDGWPVTLVADHRPMMRDHTTAAGPVTPANTGETAANNTHRQRPPARQQQEAPPAAGSCAHRRVQVPYLAPVEVVVDTHTATVDRVVVIDESVSPDHRYGYRCHDCAAVLAVGCPTMPAARAIAAADDIEWPRWEHGW